MYLPRIENKLKNNKKISAFMIFLKRCGEHDILGMSAKTTYYLLISFFPLALLLLSVVTDNNIQIFTFIVPPSVLIVLEDVIKSAPQRNMTVVSLILLIWSASTSVWALMSGVYVAHTGYRHKRMKRGRLRALIFIIFLIIFVFICVSLTFLSGMAVDWLSASIPHINSSVFNTLRILFITVLIFLFTISLYTTTPGFKMKFRYLLPGASFSSVGWIIATWGFEIYMKMFNSYSVLYGGIGAFLGLALWLYIVSVVVLFGAEINAMLYEIKKQD